jgi:uncharacterized protein (TIGR02466 family)
MGPTHQQPNKKQNTATARPPQQSDATEFASRPQITAGLLGLLDQSLLGNRIALLLLALLIASLAMNVSLMVRLSSPTNAHGNTFRPLDRVKMDLYSRKDHVELALATLDEASKYSGERGEGRQGWLTLLKAWDYDKQSDFIGENLMINYQKLQGYEMIGFIELKIAANWSKSRILKVLNEKEYTHLDRLMTDSLPQRIAQKKTQAIIDPRSADAPILLDPLDPGKGCTTLAFATAFGTWDLSKILPPTLNNDIYQASIRAYEKIKRENPRMSATDLNHELWKLQRSVLDRETSSYWGGFQSIPGFRSLVNSMRIAAKKFLKNTHGLPDQDAEAKAFAHPLVVWVSVHTRESVHQPHVTLDAQVGGVYYVNVPKGSGRLELYDPRGKSPLDLKDPMSPSYAPFHRTIGIQPKPSMLVLFPGWLVHSVLQSKDLDMDRDGYRVSISLNLKGEWQTTAGLSVGCPTYGNNTN